ncbi:uncharacterized protein VTP21DRAFT_9715 [Calcarisporiella thermophila]|uniref:uncharacterized protein n=1 Tax=Calcarisporiella thermophila TaxID=911321 RepID=UPI003742725F
MPTLTQENIVTLNILAFVFSMISSITIIIAIALSFIVGQYKHFRRRLIIALMVSDLIFNLAMVSSSSKAAFTGSTFEGAACQVSGFMMQTFIVTTDYWIFVICIWTYIILTSWDPSKSGRPTWIQRNEKSIHILVWGIGIITGLIPLSTIRYIPVGAWCWIPIDIQRFILNYIPRYIVMATVVILYARVFYMMRQHERYVREVELLTENQNLAVNAQRVMHLTMIFPFCYVALWIFPCINRIYDALVGPVMWLTAMETVCLPIQGVFNVFIYGFNERLVQEVLEWWRTYPLKPTPTLVMETKRNAATMAGPFIDAKIITGKANIAEAPPIASPITGVLHMSLSAFLMGLFNKPYA